MHRDQQGTCPRPIAHHSGCAQIMEANSEPHSMGRDARAARDQPRISATAERLLGTRLAPLRAQAQTVGAAGKELPLGLGVNRDGLRKSASGNGAT